MQLARRRPVRLARRHSARGWSSARAQPFRQVRLEAARRGDPPQPGAALSACLLPAAWWALRRAAVVRRCFRRAEAWSSEPVQSVWWALRRGVAARRCFRWAEAWSSELA